MCVKPFFHNFPTHHAKIFVSLVKQSRMIPIEKDLAAQIEQDQNWILRYVAAHEAGIVDYHNRLTFDHVDHMNARHPLRR